MQIQSSVAVLASWVPACLDAAQHWQPMHSMQAPVKPPTQALVRELSSEANELRMSTSEAKAGMPGEGKAKHWLQTPFWQKGADVSHRAQPVH